MECCRSNGWGLMVLLLLPPLPFVIDGTDCGEAIEVECNSWAIAIFSRFTLSLTLRLDILAATSLNAALATAAALSRFDLSASSSTHSAHVRDMIRHPPPPLGRRNCTKGW